MQNDSTKDKKKKKLKFIMRMEINKGGRQLTRAGKVGVKTILHRKIYIDILGISHHRCMPEVE